ncbi:MAG TPA: hypothetical protein VGC26_03510 [Afipia sp.]
MDTRCIFCGAHAVRVPTCCGLAGALARLAKVPADIADFGKLSEIGKETHHA